MRIRHQNYKTTAALIFQSSKVVLTGVPNPEMARKMAWRVAKSIKASYKSAKIKEIYEIGVRQLRVTNIVGSYRHPNRLAIELIYGHLKQQRLFQNHIFQIFYEPSIFPALRFKLKNKEEKETSYLIYISGRIIMTGLRNKKHLDDLFDNFLLPLVKQFPRL
nr:unnamed protein product [Meloidogyne enterolobii]CAD2201642.1 unnamed protein product [Meloidogyne enterolobii]